MAAQELVAAGEIADATAGFLDDQCSGRQVARLLAQHEERVQSARRETLSKFSTVKHALADREKIEKSKRKT